MIFHSYFCSIITVKGEELHCLEMTHQLINEQRKEPLRIPHASHPTSRDCTDVKRSTDRLTGRSGKKILCFNEFIIILCK